MDLDGATALVTGSAHRVGRGIAMSLAEQGCNIIVHYGRSEDKAKQTVSDLQDLGVEAEAISVDLRYVDTIKEFFDDINERYSYEILINSAASFIKKSVLDTTLEDWEAAVNINARAPLFNIKFAAPVLKQHDDSLIVNIADLSGIHAWDNFAAHGMSKAALLQLTKIAARELAPDTRVNAIVPGPILPPPSMSNTDPVWKGMLENIPLKKSGDPRQIGQTVVYFAQTEFVTGTVIKVDGGEELIGPNNH